MGSVCHEWVMWWGALFISSQCQALKGYIGSTYGCEPLERVIYQKITTLLLFEETLRKRLLAPPASPRGEHFPKDYGDEDQ